jgi:hypothetical protein
MHTAKKPYSVISVFGTTTLPPNSFTLLEYSSIDDFDRFYDLFYDEDIRFEYIEKFKEFVKKLNNVYPKKEALDYVDDVTKFSEINVQASSHLRDNRLSMVGIPDKLIQHYWNHNI